MRQSIEGPAGLEWNDKPLERAIAVAMIVCMLAGVAAGFMLGRL